MFILNGLEALSFYQAWVVTFRILLLYHFLLFFGIRMCEDNKFWSHFCENVF